MSTDKKMTQKDADQVLRQAYTDESGAITVDGFLSGKVGRKVVVTVSTTTSTDDTVTFSFSENGAAVLAIKVIYTDSSQAQMISAERVS